MFYKALKYNNYESRQFVPWSMKCKPSATISSIYRQYQKNLCKLHPQNQWWRSVTVSSGLIYDRICVKISCCCTPNIMALIDKHNKKPMNKIDNYKILCNLYTICNLILIDYSFCFKFYFTNLFKTILVSFSIDNYKWNLKKF